MKKKTQDTWDKLDALIQAEAESAKPQQEGEFTLAEYMGKMEILGIHLKESTARRKMERLIKDGVLTSRKATLSRNFIFYRFL